MGDFELYQLRTELTALRERIEALEDVNAGALRTRSARRAGVDVGDAFDAPPPPAQPKGEEK